MHIQPAKVSYDAIKKMGSTQLREFNVTELVKEIFPQILNKVKIKQKDKVTLQCKVNCIVTISKLVRQDSPFLFPLCYHCMH